MLEGKVKWFSNQKGFGFIAANGQDYFAHYKEIQANGFKSLPEGATVTFTPAMGDKGAVAREIKVMLQ